MDDTQQPAASADEAISPDRADGAEAGRLLLIREAALAFLRKYSSDDVPIRAMSLTYTTILSLVPLLAVTFAMLKGFGVQNRIEPLLAQALAPLGAEGADISKQIVEFVNNMQVRALGAAGIAGLLYTVVSVVGSIEHALNRIWGVHEARPMAQKVRDYLGIVLIGPVLMVTALALTAAAQQHSVVQRAVEFAPWLVWLGTVLAPNVLLAGAFTLLYKFLPNTQVPWRAALSGGVVAGIAWKLAGSAFTNFVAGSGQYAAIYSSFAVILLFFIWINFNWLIVLVGGEIAYFIQHPASVLGAGRDATPTAIEERGLALMLALSRSHLAGEAPLSLESIANRTGLATPTVEEIVGRMIEHGLLLRSQRPLGIAMARPPEAVPVTTVLDILRGPAQDSSLSAVPEPIRATLATRARAVESGLAGITLQALARSDASSDASNDPRSARPSDN